MSVGDEIKHLRLQKNLTLRELGEKAKIDYTYLSKIETGSVSPPKKRILGRVADALGVPADDLSERPERNKETYNLAVVEILRALLQRPGAITPDHWQEIQKIAREGVDDHLLKVASVVEEIPEENVPTMWSGLPTKSKRSFRKFIYSLLKSNVRFELENTKIVEELIAEGRRVLLVTQHRNVTGLIGYLMNNKPEISRLDGMVFMVSDSDDGRDALHFLQQTHLRINYIVRPRDDKTKRAKLLRAKAFLQFAGLLKEADHGTIGAMVLDERDDKNNKQLSQGPIMIAKRCEVAVVPVVARNKIEVILGTWDKHRIPLSKGKIAFGEQFEVVSGRGELWRMEVARQLDENLEELDKIVGRSLRPLQVNLGS